MKTYDCTYSNNRIVFYSHLCNIIRTGMKKEQYPLAIDKLPDLKCRDCCKCDNAGWGQYFCAQTALPIDANCPACISILPKLSAR